MKWRGLEHTPALYERLTLSGEAQLADERAWLLGDLQGDVLELGVGVGYNLRHYHAAVHLVASDIDPANVHFARQKSADHTIPFLAASADALPFAAASFDHVVATLMLCSVDSQVGTLAECARVLRPGGTVRLIEHTLSGSALIDPILHAVERPWFWFTGGCHPNRDTVGTIQRAGWRILEHQTHTFNMIHSLVIAPPL